MSTRSSKADKKWKSHPRKYYTKKSISCQKEYQFSKMILYGEFKKKLKDTLSVSRKNFPLPAT